MSINFLGSDSSFGLISYNSIVTKFAAMIRGVGPTNPNMRGEKLRGAFESLGFTNVRSMLASGNVVFETNEKDIHKLEIMVEAAFPKQLDFSRDVFIRSQTELQKLVDAQPFEELKHENAGKTYLTVTFFKSFPQNLPVLPYRPDGKSFEIIAKIDDSICCVVDLTTGKTPDMMSWLEREYGKQITTRTWLTVNRLLKKLDEM